MPHISLRVFAMALAVAGPVVAQDQSEFFSPIPEGADALFMPVESEAGVEMVEDPVVAKTRELFAELGVTYREALQRLSADGDTDRPAILETLVELEARVVGENAERRLPKVWETEMKAVRELAAQDPEIVVPVFQLHHDLYLGHRRAKNWYLLHHEMAMVRSLAALYVDETGSTGAKMVAAQVLVSLGGHMQAGGQPLSFQFFEEAVGYDPRNEAALLGMVAHYEKRGAPPEMIHRQLSRLLKAYPEHREGRLRHAVNLLREESNEKKAAAILHGLLDEETTDWVYSLAAQELARCYSRTQRVNKAIEVVEAARQRIPGDQKLAIQLSFLYDMGRRDFEAGRVAQQVSQSATLNQLADVAEPPRGRYNTWPSVALNEDRRQLRELARSREPLIAQAVPKAPEPTTRATVTQVNEDNAAENGGEINR